MGAAGSDVHHHPPWRRAQPGWSLAALALPVLMGLVSCIADPLQGRAGSLGSAGEGFPLAGAEGWVPAGPPASLATSQQGCPIASPAASSLGASSSPGVRWGGCWPLSPSLGVTLGHHGESVPSYAWLHHRPAAAMRASASQWRCSSSKTRLPNQTPPTHTHSCRRAPHRQVSSCWDRGSRTGLTQPGLCRCPHGAGQCRSQG